MKDAEMVNPNPTGATLSEAHDFLAAHPDVQAIDIVLSDVHGIGRGKIIRRHELEALYTSGRGMPGSLFAQDVTGVDAQDGLDMFDDGGGDSRCWPVSGTLGLIPSTGRGVVLLQMHGADATAYPCDPRAAMMRQIDRAAAMGYAAMGAFELEFYLIDRTRDPFGAGRPAVAPLTGQACDLPNTMSVDELDAMSPFFDAVYEGARVLDLPLESLISEYATSQFELTLRYGALDRAVDEMILTRRLIRATARRFGMEACFMAKPFGEQSGSGMHLHLSLNDAEGRNLFADEPNGTSSAVMLNAIGGIRNSLSDQMLILAPNINSWRRLASTVYSPATNTWGLEDRLVALRVPEGAPKTRHFEQRVAGVDANPYLVAAVTLGASLDGIDAGTEAGPAGADGDAGYPPLDNNWGTAIETFSTSGPMKKILGGPLHQMICAVKRQEHETFAKDITAKEWKLYGAAF
jgi:glutamine synthetase